VPEPLCLGGRELSAKNTEDYVVFREQKKLDGGTSRGERTKKPRRLGAVVREGGGQGTVLGGGGP